MTQDDDTITLKDAASHFGFSVYTLRTEAGRGRLTIYKIWPDQEQDPERTGNGWDVQVVGSTPADAQTTV